MDYCQIIKKIAQKPIISYTISMKTIVLNNQLISYFTNFKANSGTPIIFLHGWRVDSKIWLETIDMMRNEGIENDIYAIDFPGFGSSPSPKEEFKLSDYCDLIEQFIIKQNLKKVILVGHSFGGRVAIKLSATKPELFEKIILVDSGGLKTDQNKKIALNVVAKIVKPFFANKLMQPLRSQIYKKIGADDYLATPELQKTFVNIINEDLSKYLNKVPGPALIIWGANDTETPLESALIMSKGIHKSKMVILDDAGHFCFQDKPEEFIQAIKEFLNV